jgi:hypothetical protein
MTVIGTLIAESRRVGAELEGLVLAATKVARSAFADVADGQPHIWTFIEFEVQDESVDQLAVALEGALSRDGGWYCDFRSVAETFVVFAGRTFRYPRGDAAGRAAAVEYGRSVGVPEAQLDWPF